jgi:hypothetical protein
VIEDAQASGTRTALRRARNKKRRPIFLPLRVDGNEKENNRGHVDFESYSLLSFLSDPLLHLVVATAPVSSSPDLSSPNNGYFFRLHLCVYPGFWLADDVSSFTSLIFLPLCLFC